jgi:hypothetical protein
MAKPMDDGFNDALWVERLTVERKTVTLALKENVRGRFLRITEDVGGRRDTVIVPAAGLLQLREALDRIIDADEQNPRPDTVFPPE